MFCDFAEPIVLWNLFDLYVNWIFSAKLSVEPNPPYLWTLTRCIALVRLQRNALYQIAETNIRFEKKQII